MHRLYLTTCIVSRLLFCQEHSSNGRLYDKEQYADCKLTWRRFHQLVDTSVKPQATSGAERQHVACATLDKTMMRAYDPYLGPATEEFRSSSLTKE